MRSSVAIGIFAFVGLTVVATPIVIHYSTMNTVSFAVEHRERAVSQNSDGQASSRYMVWGQLEDGSTEVFENTDSLLSLKFNSADLYGRMSEGRVCQATVNGFRIPFLSVNRNIIDVDCQDDS
jgi:hypothetical protein